MSHTHPYLVFRILVNVPDYFPGVACLETNQLNPTCKSNLIPLAKLVPWLFMLFFMQKNSTYIQATSLATKWRHF